MIILQIISHKKALPFFFPSPTYTFLFSPNLYKQQCRLYTKRLKLHFYY